MQKTNIISIKILFPSPRNPMGGQLGLFELTGCKTVVYGTSIMKAIQPFISTHGSLVTIAAPDLEEFLDETLVPHYDYSESLETGGKQTLAIFHTSGSSGAPKPITWTQRAIMTSGLGKRLPPGNENRVSDVSFGPGMIVLCTFPLFHVSQVKMPRVYQYH
jgi:acyl-CoA synthetase (AMP-forming)/AMP-acid ligase II